LFPTHKPDDHRSYREVLKANLREPGRMAALQTMIRLSKADTDAIVDRSQVAALIVMGAKDPDFSSPGRSAAARSAVERAKSDHRPRRSLSPRRNAGCRQQPSRRIHAGFVIRRSSRSADNPARAHLAVTDYHVAWLPRSYRSTV
jgi:hypothetical protein